jgi:integrase
MKPNEFNFTKASINSLPIPNTSKRVYYRDSQVKGLTIRVTASGSKSYCIFKKIKGKTEFFQIGKHPIITVENARNLAKAKLGQIALGSNPNDEIRKQRNEMILGQLFDEYMERHSKINKKSWIYDEREIKKFFSDWFNRKLSDITKQEIQKRLEKITKNNGRYASNHALERIRALYNKAEEWGWDGRNPAKGIKKNKKKTRDRFAQMNELPHLLKAISDEHSKMARDYFLMLILTGSRKTNMAKMRWEQIIWEQKVWRIPETKNGDPQYVALTDRAIEILEQRKAVSASVWVFPQDEDQTKYNSDCSKRAWNRTRARATLYFWNSNYSDNLFIKEWLNKFEQGVCPNSIIKQLTNIALLHKIELPPSLMDIRLHDLRRTFGSYQAIAGSSLSVIGESLGHKSLQATQIYARLNLEPVRRSINKATDIMFAA